MATKGTYYNEFDPKAAEWIRQLIILNQIPDGEVDERSIIDVANDIDSIKHFRQWHFFSGVATWAYALRQAGWSDDREVLSGSPPCQPFSSAGKQNGFDDDRHLWPYLFRIIQELRPSCVIGEQVSSKLEWWDAVASDLESADYAAAAFDLPGASIGAYHRRYRLFWVGVSSVGDSASQQLQKSSQSRADESQYTTAQLRGDSLPLSNSSSLQHERGELRKSNVQPKSTDDSCFSSLGHSKHNGHVAQLKPSGAEKEGRMQQPEGSDNTSPLGHSDGEQPEIDITGVSTSGDRQVGQHSTTEDRSRSTAIWANTHWLQCSDGKYRAADRDIYPLAAVVGMDKPRIRYELERGIGQLLSVGHLKAKAGEVEGIAKCIIDTRNFGSLKSRALSLAPRSADRVGLSGDPSFEEINDSQEARGMRLKGYGNGIVCPLAVNFIQALMESIDETSRPSTNC